jgi:hypothetical protein
VTLCVGVIQNGVLKKMISTNLLLCCLTTVVAAREAVLINGALTQLFVPPATFEQNLNFTLPQTNLSSAVVLNRLAYFIGGYNETYNVCNTVTIFNPTTNKTTNGVPMNVKRAAHAAAAVNNTIIVCGGLDDLAKQMSSCEQFNVSTQKWTFIASLPSTNSYFTMTTLDNFVYSTGGRMETGITGVSNEVFTYDGQKWNARKEMFFRLTEHSTIAVAGHRMVACGGVMCFADKCIPLTDYCGMYNTTSNKWQDIQPMLDLTKGHAMVATNDGRGFLCKINYPLPLGHIYIFGGRSSNTCDDVEEFTLGARSKMLPMKMKCDYFMSAVLIGRSFIIEDTSKWHLQLQYSA